MDSCVYVLIAAISVALKLLTMNFLAQIQMSQDSLEVAINAF